MVPQFFFDFLKNICYNIYVIKVKEIKNAAMGEWLKPAPC
jgi:hypothetical protein